MNMVGHPVTDQVALADAGDWEKEVEQTKCISVNGSFMHCDVHVAVLYI